MVIIFHQGYNYKYGTKLWEYKNGNGCRYFFVCILTALIIGVITGLIIEYNMGTKVLGKAICLEEYNKDFKRYNHDYLKCKDFKKDYNGLKIEIIND